MRRPLHRLTRKPQLRQSLPLVHMVPNLVTITGLCAGLTAIRFALVERWDIAVGLILFAAVIDGLDGLIARRLNAASVFGAELDSLSDFVNFGVAPAVVVYGFALQELGDAGWVFALVFAIGCCLRLARFNVGRAEPEAPARTHFTGVPAPAGALLGLLPVYVSLGGLWAVEGAPWVVALWLGLVGALMVSKLATLSPKALRVPRERAVWVLLALALIVGVAFTQFWVLMVIASVAYGGTLVYAAVRRHPQGRG